MASVAGTVAIVITVLTFLVAKAGRSNPQERTSPAALHQPLTFVTGRGGARSHTSRRRIDAAAFLQRADPNPHHDEQRAKQMPACG